jgi:hypothetical protein
MYKDYNMFKRPFKYRPVRLLGLKSGGLTVPQATRRTAKSAADGFCANAYLRCKALFKMDIIYSNNCKSF